SLPRRRQTAAVVARCWAKCWNSVPFCQDTVMRASIVFLLSALAAFAQAPDWKKLQPEILQHYRSLIQLNTSSPPGNETLAVDYLKKVIEAEGIPVKVFSQD